MLDRNYWRAFYDDKRDAFVVEQAGWVYNEPQIEYRFTYFSEDEDADIAGLGGIDKWWLNEEGFAEGEFFAFGNYPDQESFVAAVASILQQAAQRKQDVNLDFFLAIIDIVKEQAVEAELDDESIFDFEGLFELGSEDAYSQRSYNPERLHDHVARTKYERWRLQVARVVDPQRKLLGWSLCVVLYPTLPSQASTEEIDTVESAEILELNHFHTYTEAFLAVNGTLQFMLEDGRVEEPDYAFMNDSEVFELTSIQCSIEGMIAPEWEKLEGTALRRFIDGTQPLVRPAERWHPREEDSVAQVAETMNLPLHIADQLYAQMLETMKISEPLDADSPWRMLNASD